MALVIQFIFYDEKREKRGRKGENNCESEYLRYKTIHKSNKRILISIKSGALALLFGVLKFLFTFWGRGLKHCIVLS